MHIGILGFQDFEVCINYKEQKTPNILCGFGTLKLQSDTNEAQRETKNSRKNKTKMGTHISKQQMEGVSMQGITNGNSLGKMARGISELQNLWLT